MESQTKLRRQLARFQTQVFERSKEVSAEDVETWLEDDRKEATRFGQRGHKEFGGSAEFPAHGGPRKLLEYQNEVLSVTRELIKAGESCIISLPTGAGKTTTGVHLMFEALKLGCTRLAWLAPQRLLIEQAYLEFGQAWWTVRQTTSVRVCDVEHFRPDQVDDSVAEITFDTLQKWLRVPRGTPAPELVIIDECHHIEANEFGRLVDRLRQRGAAVIGLSATPGRTFESEGGALRRRFGGNLVFPKALGEEPVEALQRRGVYSRLRYQQLEPLYSSDREIVQRRRGGISPSLAAQSAGRLDSILEYVRYDATDRKGIVFGYSIAQCHVIAAGIYKNGYSVSVVDSDKPQNVNRRRIAAFLSNETQFLVNVRYLAVGADLPSADLAILSVPIGSPIFFEQIIGRVCRGPLVGGGEESIIADFDDHIGRYGLPRGYARFKGEWA
ncbi:DEAD/DEAH box helicase [Halorhodospira sp. 9621]|uniref:DEAD/DEAH box helicase n=1 Tax=Halorhodospira sp. 9621 TaxID=2899135 RepID=UPI003084013A